MSISIYCLIGGIREKLAYLEEKSNDDTLTQVIAGHLVALYNSISEICNVVENQITRSDVNLSNSPEGIKRSFSEECVIVDNGAFSLQEMLVVGHSPKVLKGESPSCAITQRIETTHVRTF